jgi:hypothetical protein
MPAVPFQIAEYGGVAGSTWAEGPACSDHWSILPPPILKDNGSETGMMMPAPLSRLVVAALFPVWE